MKIFGHSFVFPVMIHRTSTFFGDKPQISLRFDKSKMGGSMRSTSYTIEIETRKRKIQWSFVWRPDVTRYWWNDHKRRHITPADRRSK